MSNHPNRGAGRDGNPTPDEIYAARTARGMSQASAAAIVHSSARAWNDWETGARRMHVGLWVLFKMMAPDTPETVAEKLRGARAIIDRINRGA
mgnify:FL=1